MNLNINNTFSTQLPADANTSNTIRQVFNACFSYVQPTQPKQPKIIHTSAEMLSNVGISQQEATTQLFTNIFTGNQIYHNTQPYAMCYGGHQFGSWAAQLGDGRAINLFEINHNNKQWALQLKGAGKTPYSRSADGLAVLRSSIREYLCSEAMYHLGVPTTRALSLALTGNEVLRDVLYNGNAAYEKGAIVCRVAPSFIRFGNFEILAARKDEKTLKALTDYTIQNFYNHLGKPNSQTYLQFFEEVATRTLQLIVDWERVGFVHGVMNTDNMSILGLTIDYGPYGWLEDYNPNWTPNTTDAATHRYCFGNQASIALWNIIQLANALYILIEDAPALEKIINTARKNYWNAHYEMMNKKLGLNSEASSEKLIEDLKQLLQKWEIDYTLFFRNLSKFNIDNKEDILNQLQHYSYYNNFNVSNTEWNKWFDDYATVLITHALPNKKIVMDSTNPKYVLRNYMAQLAIDAANNEDYNLIDELYTLLLQPYSEQPLMEKWFAKRPTWANDKVGCSMLSCSS